LNRAHKLQGVFERVVPIPNQKFSREKNTRMGALEKFRKGHCLPKELKVRRWSGTDGGKAGTYTLDMILEHASYRFTMLNIFFCYDRQVANLIPIVGHEIFE
jgi:hypothetical protein